MVKTQKTKLKAEKRKIFGRRVKKLRSDGILPANLYGKDIKSQSISVDYKEFSDTFEEVGETGLVELAINGGKDLALIHNTQKDPVTGDYLHADFLRVSLKEKVNVSIPLELVGESPAEKQGLGTVVQYLDEIEIEALPTDLPEKFEVDISKLMEVDQAIMVKDLNVDKNKVGVSHEADQILVKVEPQREEEEEPVVAEAEKAPEEEAVTETEQAAKEVEPDEASDTGDSK